jgi:hypothetical protein
VGERVIEGPLRDVQLDTADRARARDGLARVARRLAAGAGIGPSLGTGAAGVAVALASAAVILEDDGMAAAARAAVDRAARPGLPRWSRPSTGFFDGLAGIAWASAHCQGLLGTDHVPDGDFDVLLRDALGADDPGRWGLADGVAGVALYASGRGHAPLLGLAVDAIGRCRDGRGRWSTEPVVVFGRPTAGHAGCLADTSVTHGLAGLVGPLALAARGGDQAAAELLAGAAGQLVAALEVEPGRDPLAWCCGGLGVAAALVAATPLLAHHRARALGAELLQAAAVAPTSGRGGVGLCHGTGGAFVALHRLAVATGSGAAADAARRWGRELLDEVEAGRTGDGDGLLDGRAGVVLALASATGEETGWEHALMLP